MDDYELFTEDTLNEIEEIHVGPTDDYVIHKASYYCFCQPYLDKSIKITEDREVWVHKFLKEGLH